VDAVSVVAPTRAHYEIARFFLDRGVHVLVEKPITDNLDEAADLVRRATSRRLVLQVDHLERFSAARAAIARVLTRPLYIECSRIAPFQDRGTDVSVVLDLMIHDIDLILSLVNAPVESLEAIGAPVLSSSDDIVNTRLRFANGCFANATASRVSMKNERKIRIFQPDSYISADLVANRLTLARRKTRSAKPSLGDFAIETQDFAQDDPLRTSIGMFLDAITTGTPPAVTGEDGVRALETAFRITESLKAHFRMVHERMGELSPLGGGPEAGSERVRHG
jgi:predicted dehydrogenase